MRPLIRWTIGPVLPNGFKLLKKSIRQFKEIYPEFDIIIAYNQLSNDQIKNLESLNIPIYNQELYLHEFSIVPNKGYYVYWKLYPTRFNIDAHEIIIDNDIFIERRIKEIDLFLKTDSVLLSQGIHGQHGVYDQYIPKGMRLNSGVFGMPPGFNFIEQLSTFLDPNNLPPWNDYFDEQGLVGAVLASYHTYYIIPLTTLPIIQPDFDIKALTNPLCCGYHFTGLNYKEEHESYNYWLNQKTTFL